MTMSPEDFHDLMVAATTPEPAQGSVASDVAAGRRLLRRHRSVAAVGAAAAVVAVAGTAWAVTPGGGSPSSAPVASAHDDPPTTDQGLLDSCRRGNQSDRATRAIFGAGEPTVEAVSRTEHQAIAALESADGDYWGECFVHLDSQEFASGMTVWPAAGHDPDSSYSTGPGCGLVDGDVDPDCQTFAVSWVDRRPEAVAVAEFVTADGRTTRVRSADGYIVFNYLGRLPEGASTEPTFMDFSPIRTITFLDASGTPIAAEAQDGSGTGPDHAHVGDLPSIREYPGLRGDQQIY